VEAQHRQQEQRAVEPGRAWEQAQAAEQQVQWFEANQNTIWLDRGPGSQGPRQLFRIQHEEQRRAVSTDQGQRYRPATQQEREWYERQEREQAIKRGKQWSSLGNALKE
jgi:hypothetical protein